jgi:hypothetical protein
VNKRLLFPQNNLVLTSIDIQSVEPVDQRTRDALQKSVQLAIEVRYKSIFRYDQLRMIDLDYNEFSRSSSEVSSI